MSDVTVTLSANERAELLASLEYLWSGNTPEETPDEVQRLVAKLAAAQPAEPTALDRLSAWVRHSQFHDFTVQRLLNAGWTVRLYVQVEPHLRQVTTRSAPALAAAIDAALEQAQEGKP